jgi:hypothetical protein
MNKFIDYESFFTYISLILAFAIFIVLMYGCIAENYSGSSSGSSKGGGIIERFSTTEPVHAEIASITVNSTGAITGIALGTNKGKYYAGTPPKITIAAPTAANSTQAEATAILSTTAITGTTPPLYEIDRIQITSGKGGTNYVVADKSKVTFEPIAAYKSAYSTVETEPVAAVINNMVVKSDENKGIESITLTSKGKYYENSPPKITIGAPQDNTGTAATAEVKLKTTPIVANGKLYEINNIDIKDGGKKYVAADDVSKIVLESIDDYEARVNPVITLTAEQKTNIVDLIGKCNTLTNKQSYITKINNNVLKKIDVDAIIKEVS